MTEEQVCLLRPMEEGDLDGVLAIERQSYLTPWSRAAFLGEIHGGETACSIVAVEKSLEGIEGPLVGFLCAWVVKDLMQINNLAVRHDRRGRGIGEKMMRVTLEEGGRRGATACFLDVRPSNLPAINLYKKLGFHGVGLRPGYYSDTREDALVMRLDLAGASAP